MGTGPRVKPGFDLCITEMDDLFLVEVGSELGLSLLANRAFELPSAYVQNAAAQAIEHAAAVYGPQAGYQRPAWPAHRPSGCKTLGGGGQPLPIVRQLHPGMPDLLLLGCRLIRWISSEKIPTEQRVWDSCFNPGYSYVFGGNTRPSIRSRYRQWLTHKLGTWKQQFGSLGCVGCGRCITWCPVGIDLTEEIAAVRKEVNS